MLTARKRHERCQELANLLMLRMMIDGNSEPSELYTHAAKFRGFAPLFKMRDDIGKMSRQPPLCRNRCIFLSLCATQPRHHQPDFIVSNFRREGIFQRLQSFQSLETQSRAGGLDHS